MHRRLPSSWDLWHSPPLPHPRSGSVGTGVPTGLWDLKAGLLSGSGIYWMNSSHTYKVWALWGKQGLWSRKPHTLLPFIWGLEVS